MHIAGVFGTVKTSVCSESWCAGT